MISNGLIGNYIGLTSLALALSLDAFSLCLAMGMTHPSFKTILRISLNIGLFHAFMPFIGIQIGSMLSNQFKSIASISGGAILIFFGFQMILEFFDKRKAREASTLPQGGKLLIFALGLSFDSFSIGLSLGAYGERPLSTCLIFGLVNLILACTGFLIGKKTHRFIGAYGECISGIFLILLGTRMLLLL
ncbi:manganese efflux pump MntP family protein [Heyndrickxia ginsengihumi]|uniref:Manganese efflux pump MntP n=1 Tax=Heyndrickxia ginsengihumi TaxID=363870 RepID=A0A6M0P2N9_9BACI|nr:manganese efflux pump [Heyndrickxia ginsengihumi]MBE6184468.1 hypothetical protein [Bacillus sp. (in: firmicutes)]MCM3022717.1 manganese efflux pump MntP family protein [Heyndrickxia ginsengihumi]NEY18944.1 hypothetical protein [Heyndrickxia ginsengihumi]